VIVGVPYINLAAQHMPIRNELLAAVDRVITGGTYILGAEVAEFERSFADLCGVKYAVGVNSGTDALILALKALGIGSGDEVITSPNGFVACGGCIELAGARPVFVDVRDDYNIDPALIQQAVTSRTKAILVVHLTGRPADMDPILEIARSQGLHVIEDCAQAVCATYKDRPVGSFGAIGCFSLHPLKTLNACGDGGVVTTNVPALFQKVKLMRNLGLESRDVCLCWGHNSRLDTLQAAILNVKLRYLQEWIEKRRANARFYQEHLSSLKQLKVPTDKPYERAVYHTFVIQAEARSALQAKLAQNGIGTAIHYPTPIHLQPAAAPLGLGRGSFPMAEMHADRILSLPIYSQLGPSQLEYVVDSIHDFYGRKEA